MFHLVSDAINELLLFQISIDDQLSEKPQCLGKQLKRCLHDEQNVAVKSAKLLEFESTNFSN